jgi:glucose/arabinose dehydrogenase
MRTRATILCLLLLAACAGESDDDAAPPPGQGVTTPTAAGGREGGGGGGSASTVPPPGDPAAVQARLVKVADVNGPVAIAVRPDDDSLYVAEKGGRVRRVPKGQTPSPGVIEGGSLLDISDQVSTGSEQGLLGITFNGDGSKLYVNYTDRAGDTQVVEYAWRDGRADVGSRRVLLSVDQPFANHNGGQVSFGPDGKLYIGLGDGGSQGDPANRAQNLGDLLGKLLRIDPAPSGDKPYTVPSDNPFVGRSGAAGEVWMYGLRNPWRFSFDRVTRDLWVADVGQNAWEEVNFLPAGSQAGANFGWNLLEGSHRYKGANPDGAILPIHEYSHDEGCSVTGGYVYRGSRVPTLRGVYVYADACSGTIWGLAQEGGQLKGNAELTLGGRDALGRSGGTISSFGEDASGELYMMSLSAGLWRFEAAA